MNSIQLTKRTIDAKQRVFQRGSVRTTHHRSFADMSRIVCVSAVIILFVFSPSMGDTIVRFDTAMGSFHVQLFDTATPLTTQNFLNYVNDGDYVNTFFHRLAYTGSPSVPFVLQGGGFTYDPALELFDFVPTDAPVQNEFNFSNLYGTIAMAKTAAGPDTATSQFFFNLGDNSANLDNQNGGFTVFGQVIGSGMAVVDLLAAQQVWDASDVHSAFGELPLIDYDPGGSVPWPETLEMIYNVSIAVEGDVDGDGFVGGGDLNTVISNWGSSGATLGQGDLTYDGDVGGADYHLVLSNWGASGPTEPAGIPEPATVGMVLLGGLGLLRRRGV